MNTEQIVINNLKKSFPVFGSKPHLVLNIKSLSILKGEFFCILGASGCGKTTLLNILSGFLKPDSGHMLIDCKSITKPNPANIQVFQEYGLFPWKTVWQNVIFGLEMINNNQVEITSAAKRFINLVELDGYEHHYPAEISGGMKQRTALARALAVNPEILFMDEPFGALDFLTRLNMQKELERIWIETKKTVLFVTHNVEEALALADRIAVMTPAGGIAKIINISSSRPRYLTTDKYILDIKRELYTLLGVE